MTASKQIKFPVNDLLDATADAKTLLRTYADGDFDGTGADPRSTKSVIDYGADPTGVADSTDAWLDADAAAEAAGGDVYFPAGIYRIDSRILADSTSAGGAISTMRPRRWVGDGAWNDSTASADATPRGTIIDLRYSGGPAIILKPRGGLEITGITFTQRGTAHSQPMIKIINTTCNIHDCSFVGHSDVEGQTCNQDAIIFGGTTLDTIGEDDDSPFQGYGTVVSNCYFNRIRRAGSWQMFANDVRMINNVIWNKCGGPEAFWVDPVISGQYVSGVVIENNTVEMSGYNRLLSADHMSSSLIHNNGCYDEHTGTFTAVAATDILTTSLDFTNLSKVYLKSSGTLPGGLALLTPYYVIRLSSTTCKLATSYANAQAATAIDISSTGSGTHTITHLDTNGLINLVDCPSIKIDTGIMPATVPSVSYDVNSSVLLFTLVQGEESVMATQHPLRSDNFRSSGITLDGGDHEHIIQPKASATEANTDAVGFVIKDKAGNELWSQLLFGTITIGGTVAVSINTPTWYISNSGVGRVGAGASWTIDTGTGGSYLSIKAFGTILVDHAGTEFARFLSNGVVKILNLPTSSPGVTGQIWNDGGTLKIS